MTTQTTPGPPADLAAALAAPFPPNEVQWKAQSVKGSRALAVAYIDARAVMDRLDAVVGPAGWQDAFTLLPDGNVVCRLALHLEGEWVPKEDVGGESDQQDEGDKRKASFSDALKRAAVKWGVGRYLYSLPSQWVDYDPQKKQIVGTPRLPTWAMPRVNPEDELAGREDRPPPAPTRPPVAPQASAAAPPPVITLEQAEGLADALAAVSGDVVAFCRRYRVASLAEMPQASYQDALDAIERKRQKLAPPELITNEQLAELQALLRRKGFVWSNTAKLMALAERPEALRADRYAEAVGMLERSIDRISSGERPAKAR